MTSTTTYDLFVDALEHLNKASILLEQVNHSAIDLGSDAFKEIFDSINVIY